MKHTIIVVLICIAGLWSTLYGQHIGKGWVSRRSLEGAIGLESLLPSLPTHFESLPDEIKVQLVHQIIVAMPLNDALKTLSSLASTNKDWDRISHDQTFYPYWALIHIAGSDINSGEPILIKAVMANNPLVVRLLLDNGANVNIKSHFGYPVLELATDMDYIDMVKLLLDYGADVNIKSKYGNTALISATANGYIDLVRLLLDYGADINVTDKHGYTALKYLEGTDKRSPAQEEILELLKTYKPHAR